MKTKTIFEEEILKEIQDLPQMLQEKLAKIVHFFKNEIISTNTDEKVATGEFYLYVEHGKMIEPLTSR